jgi:hypothetical protein
MGYQIKFYGSEQSETTDVELSAWTNGHNEITIDIYDNCENLISLDKKTAIRFVRELKKQIALLED